MFLSRIERQLLDTGAGAALLEALITTAAGAVSATVGVAGRWDRHQAGPGPAVVAGENPLNALPASGMIRPVDIYLETERLTLRQFTADDADLLIELDSDPAVMRYLTGGEATAPEVVRNGYIPHIIGGYEKWDGRLGLFAAQERDGGAFIGWFCLRPEPDGPRDEAELGYRLRQASWGKGYATEGSQALLRKGFTELGVRTVWAETMVVNRASRHVMEKLAMSFAGSLPTPPDMEMVEGSEHGGVRYEITQEQWAAQR
ncbi:GNAT family N-acetyltransferase [Streptacidiphilus sp. PAMC 29251]